MPIWGRNYEPLPGIRPRLFGVVQQHAVKVAATVMDARFSTVLSVTANEMRARGRNTIVRAPGLMSLRAAPTNGKSAGVSQYAAISETNVSARVGYPRLLGDPEVQFRELLPGTRREEDASRHDQL